MSFVIVAGLLATLALVTLIGAGWIAQKFPAQGQFVDVQGARMHVVELGRRDVAAPPVVLLHGASANLETLRDPLAVQLAKNHRVILIDRPGHGWSTREHLHDSTPKAQARIIDATLAKLGVSQAILVAHSWAGGLAAALALDYPQRVAGMVLLAPATHPWPGGIAWHHHVTTFPVLGPLFARTLALPIGLALMNPGARSVFLPQTMPDNYVRATFLPLLLRPAEFIANAWDMVTLKAALAEQSQRYAQITAPTVIITGDTDSAVYPDVHARPLARTLRDAELIVLPGVGHLVQNAAPDVVSAAVARLGARSGAQASAHPRASGAGVAQ